MEETDAVWRVGMGRAKAIAWAEGGRAWLGERFGVGEGALG